MPNEFAASKGSGIAGWMVHGQGNRLVGGESRNPTFLHKAKVEPLALMEIVIFQIETLQRRVCPGQLLRLPKGFKQP